MTLPQPPPSEQALRSIRWRNWIWGVGLICATITLAGLTAPMAIRCKKKSDTVEAVNNLRQLGLALFEFETFYGEFPSNNTISDLKSQNLSSTIPLGTTSSNDYFRQLLAAEVAMSEDMFYAKLKGSKKPDNDYQGNLALEFGECSFTYIHGLSTKNDPETPVAFWPVVKGQRKFDYKFAKKINANAVILRIDNSVRSYPISKSGQVLINGKDIFDPTQPFWNGTPPDIKWPE